MYLLKFTVMNEYNIGTPENPETVQEYHGATLEATEANYAEQMAFAKAEAYNGEITMEDIPDEDTPPTQLDMFEAQLAYTAMMTGTLLEE
jgi:hypothetical protein